jgi:hypothetical protein
MLLVHEVACSLRPSLPSDARRRASKRQRAHDARLPLYPKGLWARSPIGGRDAVATTDRPLSWTGPTKNVGLQSDRTRPLCQLLGSEA